jgi:hypothetical protein
MYEKLGQHI